MMVLLATGDGRTYQDASGEILLRLYSNMNRPMFNVRKVGMVVAGLAILTVATMAVAEPLTITIAKPELCARIGIQNGVRPRVRMGPRFRWIATACC